MAGPGGSAPRRRGPLDELQREMGRLLQSFEPFGTWRAARPFPAINLFDAGDRYVLTAEVPGMAPDAIEIALTGEVLELRGERVVEHRADEESYRRRERPLGRWARSVTLPGRVDGNRVTAQCERGTLTIILPRADEALPRQIAVQTSPGEALGPAPTPGPDGGVRQGE